MRKKVSLKAPAGKKTAKSSRVQKKDFFTILVVDGVADDPGLFDEFLKSEGHFTFRAESAADALEKTRKYQPDLILLGCDMPDINCVELLPQLLLEQPSAAVIVVASHPTTREAVEAMKIGAMDFLLYPLDLKELKAAIDYHKSLFKTQD
jgi:DNA-binding NtrC family response regulator